MKKKKHFLFEFKDLLKRLQQRDILKGLLRGLFGPRVKKSLPDDDAFFLSVDVVEKESTAFGNVLSSSLLWCELSFG